MFGFPGKRTFFHCVFIYILSAFYGLSGSQLIDPASMEEHLKELLLPEALQGAEISLLMTEGDTELLARQVKGYADQLRYEPDTL